jgi:hypothetical protein
MKTWIPWIAAWSPRWIAFCATVAVISIVVGFWLVRAGQSRIYPLSPWERKLEVVSVKAFVFAVIGMILGCIGLLICK